ncbi:hypothetical protein ACOH3G_11760, partial [Escherichia coli]|uniref:hypothetical protein n=1 Tax=Escherichia coli TaxID=562 RepID=UPI003B59C958
MRGSKGRELATSRSSLTVRAGNIRDDDIRLKFRTAVRVTVPVTDGWPDAIACTQSAQTEFSGTVKQTGTPSAQVIIRNGTTP